MSRDPSTMQPLTPDEIAGEIQAAASQAAQDVQEQRFAQIEQTTQPEQESYPLTLGTPGGEEVPPQPNDAPRLSAKEETTEQETTDQLAGTEVREEVREEVQQEVQAEVRDMVREHERRRRIFPRAALVGLAAGLLAVAFRYALDAAETGRNMLWRFAHAMPPLVGFCLLLAVGTGCGAVSVWLVQRFAPEASGSGIPHLEAVLHRLRALRWRRLLPVKFLGGVLSLGGGLALGREGPTVQMGGSLGAAVAERFGSNARERQTLIAAGAGAGLAAAFNAPLSGVVFVLEELQRDFSPGVFGGTFVACVVADIVARVLTGQLPAFHTSVQGVPPLQGLPLFALLGMLCGVMGVVFNRALLTSLRFNEALRARFSQRFPRGAGLATGGLAGALAGLVGWFLPQGVGGGHTLVELTLSGKLTLYALAGWFVLRFLLTMTSYGSGAPGGIFAPLLVLGAQLGLGVGLLSSHWFPQAAPSTQVFAVVGMAAYFTAIVRAPLTGIVLIIEMTGAYSLMLPLLAACFCAYGVADLLGDLPIYEALLERDLMRAQDVPHLDGTLLLHLTVSQGAPFEGRTLGELDLPAGCLIVTVERHLQTQVATPTTRLEAGDKLSAVIAPEAASAVPLLRDGTERSHHRASARHPSPPESTPLSVHEGGGRHSPQASSIAKR